jgi:hypothetical protein
MKACQARMGRTAKEYETFNHQTARPCKLRQRVGERPGAAAHTVTARQGSQPRQQAGIPASLLACPRPPHKKGLRRPVLYRADLTALLASRAREMWGSSGSTAQTRGSGAGGGVGGGGGVCVGGERRSGDVGGGGGGAQ